MSRVKPLKLTNTLAHSDNTRCLFLSLWMTSPDEIHQYRNMTMVMADDLTIQGSRMPLPVATDPLTKRYLVNRRVQYVSEVYRHDDGTTRARIVRVKVWPVERDKWTSNDSPIDMPLKEFVPMFLADYRRPAAAGPDDDDENEEEVPSKRAR